MWRVIKRDDLIINICKKVRNKLSRLSNKWIESGNNIAPRRAENIFGVISYSLSQLHVYWNSWNMIHYWSTSSSPSWLYLPYFWSRCWEMSSWSDRLPSCMFPDHSLEYPQYPSKVHLSQLHNTLTIRLYFDKLQSNTTGSQGFFTHIDNDFR